MPQQLKLLFSAIFSRYEGFEESYQKAVPDWTNTDMQLEILSKTVNRPLSLTYPPSLAYRISFLKLLMNQLEKEGAELIDELYELYTELLSQQVDSPPYCYKIYHLEHSEIIMQESVNMISRGTTGLQTWPAAFHFAEWIHCNLPIFEDKRILELGSGLGFVGMFLWKTCSLQSLTMTDYHPDVLLLLSHNVHINLTSTSSDTCHASDTCADAPACDAVSTEGWSVNGDNGLTEWTHRESDCLKLTEFDWETVSASNVENLGSSIDVVVATDVVYDSSIIPSLVNVLNSLLKSGPCQVYIASTVRNTDTRNLFVSTLKLRGIEALKVTSPGSELFHYDRSVPIEILKLVLSDAT